MNAMIREALRTDRRLLGEVTEPRTVERLHRAGLTRLASWHVSLALENAFDLALSEALFKKSPYVSIRAIGEAPGSLGVGSSAMAPW